MSKFAQFIYMTEGDDTYFAPHKGGYTSEEVDAIRKKEGIKFNPDVGHPTQRSNTTATYAKFFNMLPPEHKEGIGLDYSAGLGMGSSMLRDEFDAKIESYEPFPHDRATGITHRGLNSLPNKKYDYILNSAVLNVVEQDIRDHIVKDIWAHLKPEGIAIIGVRSRTDVLGAKTALVLNNETAEVIDRQRGSYQKGFTSGELVSYIRKLLPDAAVTIVSGLSQVVVKVAKSFDYGSVDKETETDIQP